MNQSQLMRVAAQNPASGGQNQSLDHHRNSGPNRCGSSRGGSMRQMGGIGMLQRHAEDYSLSETQMDQLDALRVNAELEKVDLRAAMRKAKIRLRAAMRDESPKESEVMTKIDEVAKCEADLKKMRFHHLQSARAVLNDKQRAQIKQFRLKQQQQKVKNYHHNQEENMGQIRDK